MKQPFTGILIGVLLVCGLSLLCSGNALANVAANTQIINQATLSYDDGTGVKTSTTAVTVTVSLVPTPPNIIPGPPQTTSYNGPGTTLTNSFIVRASSNGPDNYDLSTTISASANTTGPTAAITSGLSIYLGSTVTLAGSSQTSIVVPADGVVNAPAGIVNGIQAGDIVFINGETRTVSSVTDNAGGTSTIILTTALTNPAPGVGQLVAEQKTVTVDVTAGTITTVGTDITVDKSLTATSATDVTQTVTSGDIRDTYTSGVATLAKYVRNVFSPSGTGSPYVYSTTNYYAGGVTGKPGDTLEYILVATNSGLAPVTASVVTDVLPTDFVTLSGTTITYVDEGGVPAPLTLAAGDDAATYDGGTKTLTINLGSGATNLAGGSIAASSSVHALYKVTINP